MSNETFNVSILAPERRLIQNEAVTSLIVTTSQGEAEILPGHANLVAKLDTGRFQYTLPNGKNVTGVISSGFINIENGSAKVIAETIELPTEIDVNRAKEAQLSAEKMLNDASLDVHQFRKYQLKLQRAIIRQEIASSSFH